VKKIIALTVVSLSLCFISCLSLDPSAGGRGLSSPSESEKRNAISKAVEEATSELVENLPTDSKIAVLSGEMSSSSDDERIVIEYVMESQGVSEDYARVIVKEMGDYVAVMAGQIRSTNPSVDNNYKDYITEDLEYNLVKTGNFRLIDRQQIEVILSEQEFQWSGNVDDNSAVDVGKLAGANIVITISVIDSDSSGRITLKALDVQSAEIISMARADY
jgi:hypothetical protein